jgi:hypothetical protein
MKERFACAFLTLPTLLKMARDRHHSVCITHEKARHIWHKRLIYRA